MKKKIYIKKMNAEQSIKAKVESIAQIKIKNSVFYSVIAVFFIIFVGIGFLIFGKTYSMTTSNNGVIIKTDYSYQNSINNNTMKLAVYNNNTEEIEIKKIVYRPNDCIIEGSTCSNYSELDIQDDIYTDQGTLVLQSGNSLNITFNDFGKYFNNNKNLEIGVKYILDNSEYITTSNIIETASTSALSINSKNNEQTEEEFSFYAHNSKQWNSDIFPKARLYVKLTDNNIHMSIDENLENFDLKYKLKSDFPYKWYIENPLKSTTYNAKMLGETNYSNYQVYFDYTYPTDTKSDKGPFTYENVYFNLIGTPKKITTDVIIKPTFFWMFEKCKTSACWSYDYQRTSEDDTVFKSDKIPQFKLTVYNKNALATAISDAITKQETKADSTIYDFNSYAQYNNHIKTAIELYNGRDYYQKCDENGKNCENKDVNQQEIDYYVNLLNTYEITERPSADYSSYNSIISDIENLNSSLYEITTYNSLMTLYNEKDNYLNYNDLHQYELDNYVNRLKTGFDALSLLDADITALEAAIETAKNIKNETYIVEEKTYKLYTDDSWNKLTTALAEAETAKSYKIDKQADVDTATENLEKALAGLKKTPSVTTNLKVAITEANAIENKTYTVGEESYKLYTEDSWNKLTTALAKAETAKSYKIDKQADVDTATENLEKALAGLKKTPAVTTNLKATITEANAIENKTYTVGEESYKLYTEDSWNKLTTALAKAETAKSYEIDKQADVDTATQKLKEAIEGLSKTPAVTTSLKAAITEAETKENTTYTVEEKEYTLYTKETWETFSTALNAAKDVQNNTIDQQKAVNTATENLEKALAGLKKTSAITTSLKAAITKSTGKKNTKYTVEEKEYTLYTKETWEAFSTALNAAKAVQNNTIDQQDAVNTATENLEKALAGLKKTSAVTTNLEAAITKSTGKKNTKYTVEEKEYTLYTKETWEAFSTALNAAKDVRNNTIDQQKAVDDATENLEKALAGLKKTSAVTTSLKAAITEAETKENKTYTVGEKEYTLYTKETWEAFSTALNAAKAVQNNTIDQQKAVDDATNALKTAIEGLKKTSAVTTSLKAAITEAETKENKTYTVGEESYKLYTDDSWNKLTTALAKAATAKTYKIDQQEAVDDATQKLKEAIEGLSKTSAVTTNLEAAITEAKEKKNTKYTVEEKEYTLYTKETWEAFSTALNAAKDVRNNTIDQQEAVNTATENLEKALAGLKKTPAVTTSLKAAITEAETKENKTYTVGEKEYTLYTDETWTPFTTALNAAKDVRNNTIDQQKAVDDVTNALKTAIEGLKKRSAVTTSLKAAITEANAIENKTYTVEEKKYTLYTEKTWNDMIVAKTEAEAVKNYKIDRQKAVDDATNALKTAIEGLKKTSAVTTKLKEELSKANAIDNKTYTVGEKTYTLYTDETWVSFTTALNTAKAVQNNTIDQQDAVNTATNALKDAIADLKKRAAITTNLEAAITEATGKKNKTYTVGEKKYTLYTEKTWNDVIVAKTEAEAVKNYKIDRQKAVDDATSALNNAIENLVKTRGVYTNVESIVNHYNKYKDAGYYLNDNVDLDNYISAINYNLKIDEQAKINSIAEELERKVSSLEYKIADYSNLDKIIGDYYNSEDYINNYYDEEDKKSLEEYINSIDRTIVIINQEKVTKIETDLKLKIASLKYLPADYTKINDLVSKINKLNKDNYSNFKDLQKLIDSIIYDKTIKEQNYVDKLYSQLYTSYKSLKTKDPDQESSNNSHSSTEQDNNKKLNYKDLIEYITVNDNKVDMTTDSFKHKVSKYTTEAIIKVGLKNKNYKVTIEGNKKLKSGSNIYQIIIKDNKNKKYTYSLEVIKEDASNYLSNIKISGYEIEFNKKTQSYKIKISEEVEKLNIEAIPEDKDAQVIIEGNDNLKNKSVVTIKVIATDKEERLYKIHIIKELVPAEEIKEEKDSKTIIPYVVVGIVATTIIGIGSYILFIKPKKF